VTTQSPTAAGWRAACAYGFMAAPLAFAALPLYVLFPQFYATELGLSLGALGALLLLVRALDAITDPLIGRWLDAHLHTHNLLRMALVACVVLVAGFWATFNPLQQWSNTQLLLWAALMLTACTAAYSLLTLALQTWVSRLDAGTGAHGLAQVQRRLIAWREGFGLLGVVVGASLPAWLGMSATTTALLVFTVLALLAWQWVSQRLPISDAAPHTVPATTTAIATTTPASAAHTANNPDTGNTQHAADAVVGQASFFKQLMWVHVINGMASAVPATLVLFFVRDRLQAPAGSEGLFLLLYFAAAGLGMPLWQKAMQRIGLVKAWGIAMLMATAAFAATANLGAGDAVWFALVCLGSGVALGADLCVPQAMLAQWLNRPHTESTEDTERRQDGVYFGWWNVVSKGNLALAAGVSLPLLGVLGYVPGAPEQTQALAWVYGALPCALKITAAALLWRFWLKGPTHVDANTPDQST
jgi:glycoside/pentoside/hexuronide:cation symporter, GPH family